MATEDTAGLRLVTLGFVAVIALAGLVLMFTQAGLTGGVSGMQKLGTEGNIERTPYEACRVIQEDVEYVWNGMIDPWNQLIACVDPRDPTNEKKVYWAELKLKYG